MEDFVPVFDLHNDIADLIDGIGNESAGEQVTYYAESDFVFVFRGHVTVAHCCHSYYGEIEAF